MVPSQSTRSSTCAQERVLTSLARFSSFVIGGLLVVMSFVVHTGKCVNAAPALFPNTEGTYEGTQTILDETAEVLGWSERTGGEYGAYQLRHRDFSRGGKEMVYDLNSMPHMDYQSIRGEAPDQSLGEGVMGYRDFNWWGDDQVQEAVYFNMESHRPGEPWGFQVTVMYYDFDKASEPTPDEALRVARTLVARAVSVRERLANPSLPTPTPEPASDLCQSVECAPFCEDESTSWTEGACLPESGECEYTVYNCFYGCNAQTGLCNPAPACEDMCVDMCVGDELHFNSHCNAAGECIYEVEPCGAGCNPDTLQCNPEREASTPTVTPAANDLRIVDAKLLQAIENPLHYVSGKPTALYVQLGWSDAQTSPDVLVSLEVDGAAFGTQRIGLKGSYSEEEHRALLDAVVFHIPSNWVPSGPHTFHVIASLENTAAFADANPGNNEVTIEKEFKMARALRVMVGSVHPDIGLVTDVGRFWSRAKTHMLNVYPIRDLILVDTFQTNTSRVYTPMSVAVLKMARFRQLYNSQLKAGQPPVDYLVGLFPDDHYGAEVYGASFWWARHNVLVGAGNSNANAHEAMVHEINHDFIGGVEEYNDDREGYFLAPGTMIYKGQQQQIEILYEVPIVGGICFAPRSEPHTQYINFMGTAGSPNCPTWVNTYWDEAFFKLAHQLWEGSRAPDGMARAVPAHYYEVAEEQRVTGALVDGAIGSDGSVDVHNVLWLDQLSLLVEQPESEYYLQVVGNGGERLVGVPVHVDFAEADPAPFSTVIPVAKADAARINLTYQGDVLWHTEPSASAPRLQVTAPAGSMPLSGLVDLAWDGSDADGDVLNYVVFISHDDGESWSPAAIDVVDPQVQLDTSALPGCDDCSLRILASDGWHTTLATAEDTFAIENKAPQVTIVGPVDGAIFFTQEPVIFRATTYDLEDTSGDTNVTWISDVDGTLGTGMEFSVPGLTPGTHTITAIAQDSAGAQTQTGITIYINGNAEAVVLPPEREDPAPIEEPRDESEPPSETDADAGWVGLTGVCGAGLCGTVVIVLAGVFVVRRVARKRPPSPVQAHPPAQTPVPAGPYQSPQAQPARPASGTWRLRAIQGIHAGQAFVISKPVITIGRESTHDMQINAARISRNHARVRVQGDFLVVEDLGSSNGTFVNGRRIAQPQPLKPGDILDLAGHTKLRVERKNM
ncbi:MAG: FHA domain-containing protein [Anaerolineae bacterium]|nr:FHA domain-containing protein [Anaerolineae bacterium]